MEMSVLSEGTPFAEMSDRGTAAKTQGSRKQRRPVRVDRRHGLLRPSEVKRAVECQPVEGRAAMWGPEEVSC